MSDLGSLRQQLEEALLTREPCEAFTNEGYRCSSCDLRAIWPLVESAVAAARQETAQRTVAAIRCRLFPFERGGGDGRMVVGFDSLCDLLDEVGAALARETGGEQ